MFQEHILCDLEELPLELFDEIASYLDIPTLKALSLTSSIWRSARIRRFFRTLTLHGGHESLSSCSKFLADFQKQAPVPCFRTVVLDGLKDDLSKALLPWCTRVHSIIMRDCPVENTTLIPSLIVLHALEFANLTFGSVADYFSILASLPSTLKTMTVGGNTFCESHLTFHTVGRGVRLECLRTKSADDLSVLVRDDCPVSLKDLRVADIEQASPHDFEDLVQSAPHLIDLHHNITTSKDRPASLPLHRLKTLYITERTEDPMATVWLLSTPSSVASTLQFIYRFEHLTTALLHPTFRNLIEVHIQIIEHRLANARRSASFFGFKVRRFRQRLEEMRSEISLMTGVLLIDPANPHILRPLLLFPGLE
ncbi:hypothetical protein IW261DRAFT_1520471 [Armillaria novae-zelandiae]|uniref:F-box domain-containing protein n=1 Tax=Armillaria novae-zelandiae TaxID=153914 RepID=A0AA39NJK4_9AGAR|nr:hypothetical protein IW261DRAFT_1520471 [Armillaria novae-zelandiae]